MTLIDPSDDLLPSAPTEARQKGRSRSGAIPPCVKPLLFAGVNQMLLHSVYTRCTHRIPSSVVPHLRPNLKLSVGIR